MIEKFVVKESSTILEFLFSSMPGFKKNKVRDYLRFGAVKVNGRVTKDRARKVSPDDKVEVQTSKAELIRSKRHYPFKVVFEDDDIIVIDKPEGLLTIAVEDDDQKSVYSELTDYVRNKSRNEEARVFIVHRIDRDTSGLLVFAKKFKVKEKLQKGWSSAQKRYYAVVEGVPPKERDFVKSNLIENRFLQVYSGPRVKGSKFAVTEYKVLKRAGDHTLLEVGLDTGRKHQIRVHMADIQCPIAGDKRYGAKTDPAKRLALHAAFLSFKHPVTGEELKFESPLPEPLRRIVEG